MEFKEVQSPTTAEAAWQASVVEVYRCKDCHALTRFVRYTDPVKLLETRTVREKEGSNWIGPKYEHLEQVKARFCCAAMRGKTLVSVHIPFFIFL